MVMPSDPLLSDSVPPTVPDAEIPSEKLETATSVRRKARQAGRFLTGPIPLSWIRAHIRDPADRLLLVLRAHSDMQKSADLKVTAAILSDAGITDRKVAYRALEALEGNGAISAKRAPGRRPVVRLLCRGSR